ncbi:MAG: hypothetical protein LBU90_10435 [Bacteroidales bacterium]|jgi:hypothetical protein|nr:hypothetical protein [Bacteroidales bacterium]
MNGIPLINGFAYDWGEIAFTLAGMPITGIIAIDYADKQEVTNNYGAGRYPISRSKGRITCTAKVTLDMEEVRAITRKLPNGRLQDCLPFNVLVAYIKEDDPTKVHCDVIHNCSFTQNSRAWKEGDTRKTVDLDLVPSHITWG